MKKNFKMMLVALFAFIGFNSANAQALDGSYIQDDTNGFRFTVIAHDDVAKTGTVSIANNSFAGTSLVIPETFTWTVTATDATGLYTFTVLQVENDAFEGATAITSVSFPKTITSIGTDAFKGCTALTTVTFAALENLANNVTSIGADAFASTAITTLDLTNTKILTLESLFEDNNAKLQTIVLPTSLTTVNTSALANCVKLSTVTFPTLPNHALEIKATAFNVTPSLTALTLPDAVNPLAANAAVPSAVTLAANALQGSSIATLTFSGKSKAQIDDINAPKLTTVTFSGEFNGYIKAGAFKNCPKLATVNFNDKITTALVTTAGSEAGIFAGAFSDGLVWAGKANTAVNGILVTINYATTKDDVLPFAKAAFSANGTAEGGNYVKLVTSTTFKDALVADLYTPTATTDYFALLVEAAEATEKLAVYTKAGTSSYYYAKFFDATNPWKIEKKQGDATVVVYGAYVDAKDAKIYMENLHIINGFYHIPAGTPVIVKTNTSDDVTITVGSAGVGAPNSTLLTSDGNNSSRILAVYNSTATNVDIAGQTLKEATTDWDIDAGALATNANTNNPNYVLYFVAPIEEYGFAYAYRRR